MSRKAARYQRGYALLIVLWILVFQSFLMVQILGAGHTAVALASNIRGAAQAQAAADGAIQEAAFHLIAAGPAHWKPDGAVHQASIGGLVLRVQAKALTGEINPNYASVMLLSGLLRAEAVPPRQAISLAQAIIIWRSPPASPEEGASALDEYRQAGKIFGPPGKFFAVLSELNDVLGMTPAIYTRIAPHLSLFQPGDPDPKTADPVVLAALSAANLSDPNGGGYEGAPAVTVTACASGPATFCRRAVLSLSSANATTPFRILALDTVQ